MRAAGTKFRTNIQYYEVAFATALLLQFNLCAVRRKRTEGDGDDDGERRGGGVMKVYQENLLSLKRIRANENMLRAKTMAY